MLDTKRFMGRSHGFMRPNIIALCAWVILSASGIAATPSTNGNESMEATGSTAARKSAIQSIPYDKLDADARTKINSVLNNVTVFRRLPTRVVNCDPDLYLFMVRHPDVVVNIWEVLGVGQLQLRQTAVDTFRIVETEGTTTTLEYLYHGRDMHIVYGEWTYTGPLLARKISGRCLAILKTAYMRDAEGHYYITSRMDGFLDVESGAADMLARTLQPLVTKNVDNNFIQTVSFIGSLSKTSEVNSKGMQRLAGRLTHVQAETRQQLTDVVTGVAQRSAANAPRKEEPTRRMASRVVVNQKAD